MRDFVAVRIESPAFEPDLVHIAELTGTEQISRLFEFHLRLALLDGSLDEEALLTSPATLVFERRSADGAAPVELRRVSGMIRAIRDRALSESKHREYIVTLVPRAWRATLTRTSDVCMDLAVPDIIAKKLREIGLDSGQDLVFRLRQHHTPREFVVQYQESHWDFACRLAEDLGIHFCFEENDGRDVLVFGDENSSFTPSQPASTPFRQRGDQIDVYELEARRELVSKSFVARDYNYRNPSMEVLGEAQTSALGEGKVDEYGPHAKTPVEATYYARVRAEEAAARSFTFEGRSDLPGLRAGSQLTVEGHPRGDVEMIVTEVVHELVQPVFGVTTGSERPYRNTFRGLPKSVAYRPARLTPKPRVHGVVTGIVESESATKMGAIDDQGRYRVAFMYDSVTGRGDGKASRPLRMAQPSAGSSRGFHAPLKPGTEVIITCVNGDPDRPIIAGAVPNPQTPSPVNASNAEKSLWTTNVNSIAIDDDKPRAKVSVNGEDHILQIGEPNGPELGVLTGSIGNVASMANGVFTNYSKVNTTYADYKASLSSKDILEAAGVPNPWSLWKKIEAVAGAAAEFTKALTTVADGIQGIYENVKTKGHKEKKEADEALKDLRERTMKVLEVEKNTTRKPVQNKDGTVRAETEDEAKARTFDELLAKPENKPLAEEMDRAKERVVAAQEEIDLYEEAPIRKADEVIREGAELVEKGAETVGKIGEAIVKVKEASESVKKLEKVIHAIPGAQKLISSVSKIFSEAAHQTLDATVMASQKTAHAVPVASRQRSKADVGSFRKPYNIQLSRHSAGLYGIANAFVFGGAHATIFSAGAANLLGEERVDVKSRSLVEVAAKNVMVTGSQIVDVHATQKMKLVAHNGDKKIDVPAGHTMYLHSKEGLLLDSVEKDIEAKAKKNVKVEAQEESVEITAKQSFKVKAHDKDVELTAEKGKIEIMANDGQATLRAKKKALVQSLDEDFTVVADKGKGTVKASKELHLESKSGQWKTSGDVEFKVKKFTVNGSKVELG